MSESSVSKETIHELIHDRLSALMPEVRIVSVEVEPDDGYPDENVVSVRVVVDGTLDAVSSDRLARATGTVISAFRELENYDFPVLYYRDFDSAQHATL